MFAFVNNIYGDRGTGRVVNIWQKMIVFIMVQKILIFNEWEEEGKMIREITVQISSSGS